MLIELEKFFSLNKTTKGYSKTDIVSMNDLYFQVFGRNFDDTCGHCIGNAFDELKNHYLSKKNPTVIKPTGLFIMRENALMDMAGTFYNRDTITDEIVLKFISRHNELAMERWLKTEFTAFPENWKQMVSSFAQTGVVSIEETKFKEETSNDLQKKELIQRLQKNSNDKLEKLCEMYPKTEWQTLNRKQRIKYLSEKAQ